MTGFMDRANTKTKWNTQLLGKRGEGIAEAHLRTLGYRILERNYRNPFGEMDLIAMEGSTVVFVEVKTRNSSRFGPPELAVDVRKQQRLSRVALGYLVGKAWTGRPCRFDVVAIRGKDVDVIRNAFETGG
jgi:putative endonuclease